MFEANSHDDIPWGTDAHPTVALGEWGVRRSRQTVTSTPANQSTNI